MTDSTDPDLPTFDLIDVLCDEGLETISVAMDIAEPCWLYAGRITEPDTGQSWRFVRRSTGLSTSSPLHQHLLDLLDGATLVDSKVEADPGMMFGTADVSLWELPR